MAEIVCEFVTPSEFRFVLFIFSVRFSVDFQIIWLYEALMFLILSENNASQ